MVWFGGLKVTYSAVSKAILRAKSRNGLDFTSRPLYSQAQSSIWTRKFCKTTKYFFSSKQTEFPDFFITILIPSVRHNLQTNLQPPNNQSDSSSGQYLSGTYSSLGRSRGHHVYATAMFCVRCAWRRFCDSSLSHDWLSSGWFACPPAAMPPETENRYAASIVWNPSITGGLLFSGRCHVTPRKRV